MIILVYNTHMANPRDVKWSLESYKIKNIRNILPSKILLWNDNLAGTYSKLLQRAY